MIEEIKNKAKIINQFIIQKASLLLFVLSVILGVIIYQVFISDDLNIVALVLLGVLFIGSIISSFNFSFKPYKELISVDHSIIDKTIIDINNLYCFLDKWYFDIKIKSHIPNELTEEELANNDFDSNHPLFLNLDNFDIKLLDINNKEIESTHYAYILHGHAIKLTCKNKSDLKNISKISFSCKSDIKIDIIFCSTKK